MNTEINLEIFNNFPEIQTNRIYFRSFIFSDTPELFAVRSNAEVMQYMDTDPQRELAESENMINAIQEAYEKKNGISWAMIDRNSHQFMGYFGFWRLMPDQCRAEIGYALKPEFHGKGYMSEAFEKMMEFGFKELKLHSIEANVNPGNIASIKVLEKAGFKKEAHFRENWLYNGKYIDSVIYGLLENDVVE